MDYKIRFATSDDYDFIYALKKENLRFYVEKIWSWDEDYQVRDFDKKFNDIKLSRKIPLSKAWLHTDRKN